MTSQLVIFRAFLFYFFRPPDPRLEKKIPVNQLIKKFWLVSLEWLSQSYYQRLHGVFDVPSQGRL